MEHLYKGLIGLLLVIVLSLGMLVTAQDTTDNDVCNLDNIHSLLAESQTAQENNELDAASNLLNNAIMQLETLMENCAIEPFPDETSPSIEELASEDNELIAPRDDGFYLVGIDVMPGRWESTGDDNGCYWARLDVDGDTIDNHYGVAGGTITVQETDFQLEINDCGTLIYVEDREQILEENAKELKENGFYTVGVEIAQGLWRSTGDGDGCYWARLDDEQDTIDNHYGNAGGTINIQETDYEVYFDDCGTWEYLGE